MACDLLQKVLEWLRTEHVLLKVKSYYCWPVYYNLDQGNLPTGTVAVTTVHKSVVVQNANAPVLWVCYYLSIQTVSWV